jgi:hypothetical protein
VNLIHNETFLRYCGPAGWLSSCWSNISRSNHANPRLHPSTWRVVSQQIHTNRSRCRRLGCFPSSGAMAVYFALRTCSCVNVYGYGVDGEGGAVAKEDACRAGATRYLKSVLCEKYYMCFDEHLAGSPDALPRVIKTVPLRNNRSHNYYAAFVRFHDIRQEWEWLARLHSRRALRWLGAADARAPDADPCYKRPPECWALDRLRAKAGRRSAR